MQRLALFIYTECFYYYLLSVYSLYRYLLPSFVLCKRVEDGREEADWQIPTRYPLEWDEGCMSSLLCSKQPGEKSTLWKDENRGSNKGEAEQRHAEDGILRSVVF